MRDPLPSLPGYALAPGGRTQPRRNSPARLGETGLRQSDVSVLMLIAANPGVTASASAASSTSSAPTWCRCSSGSRSRLIDRAPIDGKSQGLELTEAGPARLAEARKVVEAFEAELLARVPPEHRDHLLPALEALWR